MFDFEITKREVLVSITIILIMVGIGFMIATDVHDSTTSSNEKYFKALKVDNDEEIFNHAINTEVGNMVSYGTVKANEPVSSELIDGEYFAIIKIEEHYVMKTRTVTYTDANGKTRTRTETYWEWDEVDREYFQTGTFNYLGKTFDYGDIEFNHYKHNETVSEGLISNVRYQLRTIPIEFSGSLYSKATEKTIEDNVFHLDKTISELIDDKEKEADRSVNVFWIIWIMVALVVVGIFVAMENRFLNGR